MSPTALITAIRRRFTGQVPDALENVFAIYTELATEYAARGEPITGILDAIEQAAMNAQEIERGGAIGFERDMAIVTTAENAP